MSIMTYKEWLDLQPPAATDERLTQAYLAGRADFRDEAIAAVTPPAAVEQADPQAFLVAKSVVAMLRGLK